MAVEVKRRDRGEREREHEHSDRRGRDFPVFLKIRGARWLGSAPPTAEAYARALAQWRQLPGAVSGAPSDPGSAARTIKPKDD
jgi:hypothetical protein